MGISTWLQGKRAAIQKLFTETITLQQDTVLRHPDLAPSFSRAYVFGSVGEHGQQSIKSDTVDMSEGMIGECLLASSGTLEP